MSAFEAHAQSTYDDPRGWGLGGSIRFVRVASGGDFTLWLSSASQMPSFGGACDSKYSCRNGRNVVINDDRWATAAPPSNPTLAMGLDDYRHMVVNHETGHWLGFGHSSCPGAGQPAFIMQQQSKGGSSLGPCQPNPWPRSEELRELSRRKGVPILPAPTYVAINALATAGAYRTVRSDGKVSAVGGASHLGDLAGQPLNQPIVGMASTPTGGGYWLVARDGGIFSFGDAPFHGSTGGVPLNEPMVAMTGTPTGGGYWLVASDGGIFAFGDAAFHGSTGGTPLNKPVVGMSTSPGDAGYRLVASDGGIFSFDASFWGSTGSVRLNQPMAGMAATPSGNGYWMVARDGGIFTFGDAPFYGSTGASNPVPQITAMAVTQSGGGYLLLARDGDVFPFGTT